MEVTFEGYEVKICSRPLSMAGRWLFSPSVFTCLHSVHLCFQISCSYKDTSHFWIKAPANDLILT